MDKKDRKNVITVPVKKVSNQSKTDDLTNNLKKNAQFRNINFEYSIRPIYYFARAFGLLPFSVIRNSNGEIQKPHVGVINLLLFVISICWYLILAYSCYLNVTFLLYNPKTSFILVFGDYLLLIVGLISTTLFIVMDMVNRTRLVDVLKRLTVFDQKVCKGAKVYEIYIHILVILLGRKLRCGHQSRKTTSIHSPVLFELIVDSSGVWCGNIFQL